MTTDSELIERLRKRNNVASTAYCHADSRLCGEAADRLSALLEEVKGLKSALDEIDREENLNG